MYCQPVSTHSFQFPKCVEPHENNIGKELLLTGSDEKIIWALQKPLKIIKKCYQKQYNKHNFNKIKGYFTAKT